MCGLSVFEGEHREERGGGGGGRIKVSFRVFCVDFRLNLPECLESIAKLVKICLIAYSEKNEC